MALLTFNDAALVFNVQKKKKKITDIVLIYQGTAHLVIILTWPREQRRWLQKLFSFFWRTVQGTIRLSAPLLPAIHKFHLLKTQYVLFIFRLRFAPSVFSPCSTTFNCRLAHAVQRKHTKEDLGCFALHVAEFKLETRHSSCLSRTILEWRYLIILMSHHMDR